MVRAIHPSEHNKIRSRSFKMSRSSVAHSYVQNQQQSPWIDDPFQLGTHAFKELKPMSHQRNLDDYIQELVASYGKHYDDHYELDLDKLSSPYQLELASLYIESIDREIEWACYGKDQTLNSDFLCALLSMLKDSTHETRLNFAQVTTRNILVYYKDTLQKLLDEGCELYFNNEMHEAGYRADYDQDHGDIVWGKF